MSGASGWQNPHTKNSGKKEVSDDNYKAVMRRKAEALLMKEMHKSGGKGASLQSLQELQEKVESENRTVEALPKPRRHLIQAAPTREAFSTVMKFGEDVRCLEVTHGGATIWSAGNDGSLQIRGGNRGTIVHTLPLGREGVYVDVLQATDTHMWVGLSDGTVQVYDHTVFMHVTEGTFHTAGVTAFAFAHNGRMFSGSSDGSLVRWDTEAHNFEAMAKILPGHKSGITALATYGTSLFSASQDGEIRCVDVNSGTLGAILEGHTAAVNALAVVDGSLFSGGADSTLRVWSATGNECFKTIETAAPVIALSPEHAAHRLLVGLQDGIIDVLRTLREDNFLVETTHSDHKGLPLVGLKALTSVDSLKICTLGSNGINKVWFSSVNRVEAAIQDAVAALKAVIQQDTIELDRWNALVRHLQNVDRRRKYQLSGSLEAYHQDLLRRRYQYKLREYVRFCKSWRRKRAIAKRLAEEEHIRFARRYFSKYFRWYRASQNRRLKTRYADLLYSTHERNTVLFYFRKAQAFARHIKASVKQRQLMEIMFSDNKRYMQHTYFQKWVRLRERRKVLATKKRYIVALTSSAALALQRSAYLRWLQVLRRKVIRQRRVQFGNLLLDLTTKAHRLTPYRRWFQWSRQRVARKRHVAMAQRLLLCTQRGTRQVYWVKWVLHCSLRKEARLAGERDGAERKLELIKTQYDALRHIVDEKKALDDLRVRIDTETALLDERSKKLKALRDTKDSLVEAVAQRDLAVQNQQKSAQEQLSNLMFTLKAKVLNFHLDYPLMHNVRERLTQGQAVHKIFLEAHQAIKRVVVEITKKPYLAAGEWPLNLEQIHDLPPHQLNVLLTAIKTLIITFDVMDKEARDSMNTDVEIVANARWLILIADVCIAHRRKVLGRR